MRRPRRPGRLGQCFRLNAVGDPTHLQMISVLPHPLCMQIWKPSGAMGPLSLELLANGVKLPCSFALQHHAQLGDLGQRTQHSPLLQLQHALTPPSQLRQQPLRIEPQNTVSGYWRLLRWLPPMLWALARRAQYRDTGASCGGRRQCYGLWHCPRRNSAVLGFVFVCRDHCKSTQFA